jgi:hypothetical protein
MIIIFHGAGKFLKKKIALKTGKRKAKHLKETCPSSTSSTINPTLLEKLA